MFVATNTLKHVFVAIEIMFVAAPANDIIQNVRKHKCLKGTPI